MFQNLMSKLQSSESVALFVLALVAALVAIIEQVVPDAESKALLINLISYAGVVISVGSFSADKVVNILSAYPERMGEFVQGSLDTLEEAIHKDIPDNWEEKIVNGVVAELEKRQKAA